MRHNKSALIGFLFILFVLAILTLIKLLTKQDNLANPTIDTNHSNTQEFGTSETIIEYTDHYSYTIFYPVTGKTNIDTDLRSLTDSFISDFLDEYGDYKAKSLEDLATLTVTYDSYLTGNRILSVVFLLEDYNPTSSVLSQKVAIANFDLEKDGRLTMEDFFKPSYPNLFADHLSEYLTTMPEYGESFKQELLEHIPFYLTNSGITLCVQISNSDTEQLELIEYNISVENLLPVLKQNPFLPADSTENHNENAQNQVLPAIDAPPIDPDKPMVALTFDDGPLAKVTNRILDVLEENQARATFFILGSSIRKEKATIKRIISLGCQIGNHSYSHKSLTALKKKSLKYEIEQTNVVLRKLFSRKTEIVRPPFGAVNSFMRNHVDFPFIHWSIDTMDWKTKNKKKTIKQVMNHIKDGDIVLMHDLYESTADACEVIIPNLIKEGYQLVTIHELFENKGIRLKDGKSYYFAR